MDKSDILDGLRTELGYTSSLEPRRFRDVLQEAEPEDLRLVLDRAAPGRRFFLCKQVATLPDSERKLAIALVLAEDQKGELTAGVEHILHSLSHAYRKKFILLALKTFELSCWEAAVDLAIKENFTSAIAAIITAWAGKPPAFQKALIPALVGLRHAKGVAFLRQELKSADEEMVKIILDASLQLPRHRLRKEYERFSRHGNPAIRLLAIKGLCSKANWWTRKKLLVILRQEDDLHCFNLLCRTLQSRPNQGLVECLFDAAVFHETPRIAESAARYFRQLPELMTRDFCHEKLRQNNMQAMAFAIQELALLGGEHVVELLNEIIADQGIPDYIRSTAVEGLVQHKSDDVIGRLFAMVDETDSPFLLSSALSTLTRLCDERHIGPITRILQLDDDKHAVEIQAMLSFLQRKVRAKKLELTPALISVLSSITCRGRNHNCRYLAISVLVTGGVRADIRPFLQLAAEQMSADFEQQLCAFLAGNLQDSTRIFQRWLMADERSQQEVCLGLQAICATHNRRPDMDAVLFSNLLRWKKGQRTSAYQRPVAAALQHLLSNKATREMVAEQLTATDAAINGLLAHMEGLPAREMMAIAHDTLIDWLEANPASRHTAALIAIIAQFRTQRARDCLVKLFRESPLKGVISQSIHRAILKV